MFRARSSSPAFSYRGVCAACSYDKPTLLLSLCAHTHSRQHSNQIKVHKLDLLVLLQPCTDRYKEGHSHTPVTSPPTCVHT